MDVFAELFGGCYKDMRQDTGSNDSATTTTATSTTIAPFTMEELQASLRQLRSGKLTDANGIVVEMLKHEGGDLRNVLLIMRSDITSSYQIRGRIRL